MFPFDVAKAHGENIAGPQAKARQEEQDRPVADAMRRGKIAGGNQSLDLVNADVTRQSGQPPLRNRRDRLFEAGRGHAVRSEKPQKAAESLRHCLDVGGRRPLGLCENRPTNEGGVVRLRVCAERRQQAHQHAAMTVDGAVRDTAMPPQPILELEDLAIRGPGPRRRERRRCTLFHKEVDKAPDAVHVLCRNMVAPSGARAAASVPRKPPDNGVVDASDSNARELKPLREVTGRGFVIGHRQTSICQARQSQRELIHVRSKRARIHPLPASR